MFVDAFASKSRAPLNLHSSPNKRLITRSLNNSQLYPRYFNLFKSCWGCKIDDVWGSGAQRWASFRGDWLSLTSLISVNIETRGGRQSPKKRSLFRWWCWLQSARVFVESGSSRRRGFLLELVGHLVFLTNRCAGTTYVLVASLIKVQSNSFQWNDCYDPRIC